MTKIKVGFKRLSDIAILPTKANVTDSGYDLYAAEDVVIEPGETAVVKTDIAVVLPTGYEAQVRPRSGVSSKTDLLVVLGTVDNTYRGNIGIIVDNISTTTYGIKNGEIVPNAIPYVELIDGTGEYIDRYTDFGSYKIRKNDKIAQLVVQPIPQTVAIEIDELSTSERGGNGFGSSGI